MHRRLHLRLQCGACKREQLKHVSYQFSAATGAMVNAGARIQALLRHLKCSVVHACVSYTYSHSFAATGVPRRASQMLMHV